MSSPRETYLHGHHRSVLSAHSARTAEDAAAFLLPYIESGMKLLDFGCGPGTITIGFAAAVGDSGSVLGIDISDGLLEEWKRRLEETGARNLEFRVDDIYETELEIDQFDVVYAHQILQHLGDPVGALTAATRLAKRGGLVGIREVDWGTFAAFPESSLRRSRDPQWWHSARWSSHARMDGSDARVDGHPDNDEYVDVLRRAR